MATEAAGLTAGTGAGAAPRACPVCGEALQEAPAIRAPDRLLGNAGEFEVLICARCGSGVSSPVLAAAELAVYYGGGYGSHGEPQRGPYATATAALKRVQVEMLLRRPPFAGALAARGGRALDVGCGRGDLAAGLARRGWSVDAIEPSPAAAALAERRGIRVLAPTLADAGLEAGTYDLVVLRHSLEHLPDPLADMSAVARALAPGGAVVVSLPNFASWQRSRLRGRWFHLDLPRHRVHFTPGSLEMLLERAGLRVRERFTVTSVLGLPASIQYALAGRCLAPGGLGLRVAAAVCCAAFPLTWLIDGALGERDTLHAVAERA